MTTPDMEARIAAVRRFSRFYTRQLGLLQESLVHTRFSLTEARVLYELAHRENLVRRLAGDLVIFVLRRIPFCEVDIAVVDSQFFAR